MTINQLQDEVIEEFSFLQQWMDKYEYIIDLGKQLPLIEAEYKTAQYLIRGCQSQVWLRAEMRAGVVTFTADSDAIITKGIIALLIRVLDQQTPSDIANAELYFIKAIGLQEHLSLTRASGLTSMVATLKSIAKNFCKAH